MATKSQGKDEHGKPATRASAPAGVAAVLPAAMTGRASPAKAAVGDKPVFAYIASLPQPQRGIAEAVDALAAKTLPNLQRSVKWGMSVLRSGRRVVLQLRGLHRSREAHVHQWRCARAGTAGDAGGNGQVDPSLELESVDDIDVSQIAAWMIQVASVPGVGGKKR